MAKADEEGLQKHTLNLYPGDYQKLRDLHDDIGAGAIIRRLVRFYLKQVEDTGRKSFDPEIDIKL